MLKKILSILFISILFNCIANLPIYAASKSNENNIQITKQNKANKNIVETADEGYDDPSYY